MVQHYYEDAEHVTAVDVNAWSESWSTEYAPSGGASEVINPDSDGYVYILDGESYSIERIDKSTGAITTYLSLSADYGGRSIFKLPDGDWLGFGASGVNFGVAKLSDADGSVVWETSTSGTLGPLRTAVNTNGDVFYSYWDGSAYRFKKADAATGSESTLASNANFSQFGQMIADDSYVYVRGGYNYWDLQQWTFSGTLNWEFDPELVTGDDTYCNGVAIDADGNSYWALSHYNSTDGTRYSTLKLDVNGGVVYQTQPAINPYQPQSDPYGTVSIYDGTADEMGDLDDSGNYTSRVSALSNIATPTEAAPDPGEYYLTPSTWENPTIFTDAGEVTAASASPIPATEAITGTIPPQVTNFTTTLID
jgi:hypothetical protein